MKSALYRLLLVLPHHGRRTLRRAAHDAGLGEAEADAAATVLIRDGMVEAEANGHPVTRGRPGVVLRLTDAGRTAQSDVLESRLPAGVLR